MCLKKRRGAAESGRLDGERICFTRGLKAEVLEPKYYGNDGQEDQERGRDKNHLQAYTSRPICG